MDSNSRHTERKISANPRSVKELRFVDFNRTNLRFGKRLEEAAVEVVRSGCYLNGDNVKRLERRMAELYSHKEAVACSNGLDALRLILRAYMQLGRLKEGDGVIVPANTYIASILPVVEFGLRPIPVDADISTLNLDLRKADEIVKTTSGVKAVMVVHLYGRPVYDAEIFQRWREQGILIIEDNAQAIGAGVATEDDEFLPAGGFGDASATSFYPTKNIGALGDAGLVATSDPQLAAAVRALANYGSDYRYHNIYQGFNCRMDEMQAALLNVKLDYLKDICQQRRDAANRYLKLITNPSITLPTEDADHYTVWHQFTILSPQRDRLKEYLLAKGIHTDIHYATPPHRQPCMEGVLNGDFPITDSLADQLLSLPIQDISEEDITIVAKAINDFK